MPVSPLESLRIKAKLLQKAKQRSGQTFALKDAFALIATTAGFRSWQEMKASIELHSALRPAGSSALWSVWYGSYAEGKAHIEAHGGFLLPHQKQCFVCDADYIRHLGVSLDDQDLASVGNDWVKPADATAWKRLLGKIMQKGDRA